LKHSRILLHLVDTDPLSESLLTESSLNNGFLIYAIFFINNSALTPASVPVLGAVAIVPGGLT